MIKAVVFDLDGVLIRTEPLCHEAWQRAVAPYGGKLSHEQHLDMIGTSLGYCLSYVLEQTGVGMTPEELARDYSDHLARLVDQGIELLPGARQILDTLVKRGYALGVASNSPTAYIAKTTSLAGIDSYFSCRVGSNQVENPKPAPDVYLRAAACLGVRPEECLAVEDTPSGEGSAKAARMVCIMIPDPDLARLGSNGADAVYSSLSAWLGDLERWLPGLVRKTSTKGFG